MLGINVYIYIKGVETFAEKMPKLIEVNKEIHPYAQIVNVKVIDEGTASEQPEKPSQFKQELDVESMKKIITETSEKCKNIKFVL